MKDNEKSTEDHQDLFERRWIRVGLFIVVPAMIFALICVGIRVSQYGIDHTIVVLGQRQLLADSPAAIRVTLIADGEGFFQPERITGHLVRGEERHLLFDGAVHDAGYALARNFKVPQISKGPAVLELDIRFDEKRRIVRANVEVAVEPPREGLTVPSDVKLCDMKIRVGADGNFVQALTEDRAAPTGLSSVVFLRTTDSTGGPVSIPLELGIPGAGLSSEMTREKQRTDNLGLTALMVKPVDLDYPIKVAGARYKKPSAEAHDGTVDSGVGEQVGEAYLFPRVVYSGLNAVVHNPIASRNEAVKVNVRQITRGGPIYADLFHRGRWIHASSNWVSGDGSARLTLRPRVTGPVRLQLTNSALGPGRSVAVRHLYILDEDEDFNDGLRAVLGMIKGEDDGPWARAVLKRPLEGGVGFDRRLLAAFSLSRLYAGHHSVERIINSRSEDDAELSEFKTGIQRAVMLIILLLGIAVAVVIGLISSRSRQRQERITMMILNDCEDDGTSVGDGAVPSWGSKVRTVLQGLALLLIIVGAFASIAILIDTITWGN